jgi:hypothetical protein
MFGSQLMHNGVLHEDVLAAIFAGRSGQLRHNLQFGYLKPHVLEADSRRTVRAVGRCLKTGKSVLLAKSLFFYERYTGVPRGVTIDDFLAGRKAETGPAGRLSPGRCVGYRERNEAEKGRN